MPRYIKDMPTSPEITLLLTACIKVGDASFVQRNQTATRLEDYKNSLRAWLTRQTSIKKLVVCDNSGYPLTELQAVVDQYKPAHMEVELLSYHLTDYQGRGYGFGEIDIYRYVFANSKLVARAQYVGFVAGRKFVRNIDAIVAALPAEFSIVANWLHNQSWAEADLYFVQADLFKETFIPRLLHLTDDRTKTYMERAVAKVMHELMAADHTWYPLLPYPLYDGVMGKKNIPLWQRKENWWLYNLLATQISRWHYARERTVDGRQRPHLVDTLDIKPFKKS